MMNKSRLDEITVGFKGKRVAVVGDLMLDVYVWGKATRISQEAPVPVVWVNKKSLSLGGASNVMRNVSTLGGRVRAYGVTGDDENGRELRRLLDSYGIDSGPVRADKGRRTTEKQRVIAGTQQLLRIDYEDTEDLSGSIRAEIKDDLIRSIRGGELDAVIFEDYAKGMISEDFAQDIADEARKKSLIVALDPHPSHQLRLRGLTLMTPNRSEAFGLAGVYCRDEASSVEKDKALPEVAERLRGLYDPDYLLITLGPQGVALYEKNGTHTAIPTRAREVFDVSGAGDTVISAFTLALAGGATGAEAAEISNHAAGVVVGKVGTVSVTVGELMESFESYGIK